MDLAIVERTFDRFRYSEEGCKLLKDAVGDEATEEEINRVKAVMYVTWRAAHTLLMQRLKRGARKIGEAKLEKYFDEAGE